jgi:hypothetical protein
VIDRPAARVAATALGLAAAASLGAQTFRVGPTVHVSRAGAERAHEEVILGAHPTDPRRVLGCSIVDRDRYAAGGMHGIAYASMDGGATWKPAAESTRLNGDPMCGYGPDGRAYFLSIGTDDESWKKAEWWMELFVSADGGATWGKGIVSPGGDRPYLAFDDGDGATRGIGYVVYAIRAGALDKKGPFAVPRDATVPTIEVLRSEDGWSTRTKAAVGVSLGPGFPTATGAAVLSDGSLAVLWLKRIMKRDAKGNDIGQADRQELLMSIARPRGELFGPPVKIADLVADRPASATFFSLARDATRGRYRDRLYAAWTDTRPPRPRILVAASSDGGKTWSPACAVNDVPAAKSRGRLDDYMPTVAVNRDGVVAVTWKRRFRDEDDADIRFTASRDGGATWLPSVLVAAAQGEIQGGLQRVALRPTDDGATPGSRSMKLFKGGDTSGLAADASGVFHALWADQRSGIGQVFTATIAVGDAARGSR